MIYDNHFVNSIRNFAIEAHGDQKYGKHPYSYHLDEVAFYSRDPFLNKGYLETVAYLHDVVEDTEKSVLDIQNKFGFEISNAVSFITDPEGKNRKERKQKLYKILGNLHPENLIHRASIVVISISNKKHESWFYCPILVCIFQENAYSFRIWLTFIKNIINFI